MTIPAVRTVSETDDFRLIEGLAYPFKMRDTYGTFFSAMGIGAIMFALAWSTRVTATTRLLTIGTMGLGASLVALSLAPSKLVAYLVLPFLGAGSINFLVLMNSTLQLTATAQMRGRVMALYTMALLGTTPVGALLMGWIGEEVGARAATALGGVAAILAGRWAAVRFTRDERAAIAAAPA